MTPTEAQEEREGALRKAAVGRRADAILKGRYGPVLRRWINAEVSPVAARLRQVAEAYVRGDIAEAASLIGNPTAELTAGERPLQPLMVWALRGQSLGRASAEDSSTYAEDLCLAFMASILTKLCQSKGEGVPLTALLSSAATALRDTVQGQFVVSVQGADAMQAIRERQAHYWTQRKSLARIAKQMRAQVKPQLLAEERGEVTIATRGHRKVISITDKHGELRRLELLRAPDEIDWAVMDLCWHPDDDAGEGRHRSLWLSFAGVLLYLVQGTSGWFDIGHAFKSSTGRRRKTRTAVVQLSEAAQVALTRDVERWVENAFDAQPMLVPPPDGDYLTVKHHKVTGQRPPKGLVTHADGSFAWTHGAVALAQSPWRVNPYALENPALDTSDAYVAMKLAAHRRLGADQDFYLPVNMDFRGRIYYRTPWVTPQSNDMGKSLLSFPQKISEGYGPGLYGPMGDALIMHFGNLYGHGMDKAPLATREDWLQVWGLGGDVIDADEPYTLAAHWALHKRGLSDCIPIQLDGSCNGLQHLSALMRDEVGAAQVNLVDTGHHPTDIYLRVAERATWEYSCAEEPWVYRMRRAGIRIDRKLCKPPVMVLPYGGTREAIRQSVKAAVIQQLGLEPGELGVTSPWHLSMEDGYGAFAGRPLDHHPLFNKDCGLLADLIYRHISPAIPKAMQAMATLQAIGKWVGKNALTWATGPAGQEPLWVVQAKSVSAQKQVTLRGYHFPDTIRRLTLRTHSNEVDPRAHRTGIVANFIHSLDASHLARSIALFKDRGGSCVGAIHDCVMVRPSETALMHSCLRDAFALMYQEDPLCRPVRLISTVDGEPDIEYANWYEVAAAAGVSFPVQGTWDPHQVIDSPWFFS